MKSLFHGGDAPPRRSASAASVGDAGMQWPLSASAYKLLERCGSGANSVVYRALCTANNEEVAAKVGAGPRGPPRRRRTHLRPQRSLAGQGQAQLEPSQAPA